MSLFVTILGKIKQHSGNVLIAQNVGTCLIFVARSAHAPRKQSLQSEHDQLTWSTSPKSHTISLSHEFVGEKLCCCIYIRDTQNYCSINHLMAIMEMRFVSFEVRTEPLHIIWSSFNPATPHPNALPCLKPTFTSRTIGHWLGTLTAKSLLPPPRKSVSEYSSTTFPFSVSLNTLQRLIRCGE
jgi:hypothetical protein